jgi:acyl-CoA dehydrogenase
MDVLRDAARRHGLWNALLPLERTGVTLRQRELAPLVEVTGRSPFLASDALNLATPDAENIKLLDACGTATQQNRWLDPLLDGTIRSSYCMTEPGVAGSDPDAMRTVIDIGDGTVTLNGAKHWCTGAASPDCRLLVVVAASDPDAARGARHTICLVPAQAPGVTISGGHTVFGYHDGHRGGRPTITFHDVTLPVDSILGHAGEGLGLAQRLLGPARLHHCMRLVGTAERALELLCARARERTIGWRRLADDGTVQDRIAEARIRIEHLRALVHHTADLIDAGDTDAARRQISVLKASAPLAVEWICDQAIQVHGADGLSHELPLAMLWTYARTLRFSDGPDEAHRRSVARTELRGPAVG